MSELYVPLGNILPMAHNSHSASFNDIEACLAIQRYACSGHHTSAIVMVYFSDIGGQGRRSSVSYTNNPECTDVPRLVNRTQTKEPADSVVVASFFWVKEISEAIDLLKGKIL
ncbi:hypothetical protein TNCV_4897301 [Trichonephila clavipes]|nr:hypothetical protein TNCV_4897301 [Trichonephila clavipes]